MFRVDFQKTYTDLNGVAITVIVVAGDDNAPYVFREHEYCGGYCYFISGDYYMKSPTRLTVEQLMDESLLPDNLYWERL